MRAYEYQTPVDEAAMNPSAFAAAVAQGTGQGVLVGYEFEVCIPEATLSGASGSENTADVVSDYIKRNEGEMFDLILYWEKPFKEFSNIFKFKDTGIPYRSLPEAREAMLKEELIPKIIAAYEKIPQKTLIKYRDSALEAVKGRSEWRKMTATQKQVAFADRLGQMIYYNTRGDTAKLGQALRRIADTADSASDVLAWIFKSQDGIGPVAERFNELFDYDPQQAQDYFKTTDWADEDDDDDEYVGFGKASKILQAAVQNTFNRNTTVFTSYHQKKKNLTDWYIEPDGSIEPNEDYADAAAEVVSPPYPAAEAMAVLNAFYELAGQLQLYTNSTTGLHINVSIPEKIDILKLAVFLGDQYVLKYFGREDNDYAQSVMQGLRNSAEFTGTKNSIMILQKMIKALSGRHSASISSNGKYISFRHAGGDYLSDLQGISNTVGRFINAMLIASDPAAYRNEYLTKLAKLFPGNAPEANNTKLQAVILQVRKIRQEGLPVAIKDLGYYRPVPPQPSISGARQREQNNPLISREVGSQAAKTAMLAAESVSSFGTNNHQYPLVRKAPATQFVREIYSVVNGVGWALDFDDVDIHWDSSRKSFFTVSQATLPPTDPRVINYLKQLVRPLLAQKKK